MLGGRIAVFEFVNEPKSGFRYNRRSVSLEIHLLRVSEGGLVLDTVATGSEETEGLGAFPTTSVDRLLNRVFRLVVIKVVEEVAQKMAVHPRDVHVRVAIVNR